MKFKIALVSIASALSIGAQAADWSDNSVGYRYAPSQSEPGVSDKVKKNILSFTHVSGDKMGMNLFSIGNGDGTYALEPNRDSIIFTRRFTDLANLSPETLGLHLLNLTRHAAELSAKLRLESVAGSSRQPEINSTTFA